MCFKREELAWCWAGSFSFLGERVNLINRNGEINCTVTLHEVIDE